MARKTARPRWGEDVQRRWWRWNCLWSLIALLGFLLLSCTFYAALVGAYWSRSNPASSAGVTVWFGISGGVLLLALICLGIGLWKSVLADQ